jgi:RNA polymerase sigma factor (sigma-70 family)
MGDMDAERLLLDHLPLIDRIVAATCRRHRLSAEETEDFGSSLKLKLIANDYEVLRAFEGRCSLAGYLTAVIQRAFVDHRNHLWGRWRPSAEARRLGPLAVRLDTLLHRDGLTLDEACARAAPEERAELARLAARLPVRVRRRVDGEGDLETTPSPEGSPESQLLDKEREEARELLEQALAEAVGQLPDEERLLLQLRLYEGLSLVNIARSLGREVKPLYRRWETMLRHLRVALLRSGCDEQHVALALGQGAGDPGEVSRRRPSIEMGQTR